MDLGLAGRRAFVAGATSGLGRAIAEALAAEGAHVVVAGRRLELAEDLAATFSSGQAVRLDLTDAASVEAAVSETSRDRAFDIVVLNGGGPPPTTAAEVSVEQLRLGAELLLHPMQQLVQLTLPAMRSAGWGRILAVGSSGILSPIPGLSISNSIRAALWNHLRTLANEVAPDGVTVNMVIPGRIATARVASLDKAKAQREGRAVEDVQKQSRAAIPLGRYGRPEEFGAVAAFLCSEPASYLSGTTVRVDGAKVSSA